MRYIYISVSALMFATSAFAANNAALISSKERYIRCIALAERDPRTGYDQAKAWRDGGAAASHCEAIALVSLGHYSEAANILANLARNGAVGDAAMRAQLFDQAGNAWLLANLPNNAMQSFSAALAVTPNAIDVLADRARARAMLKDWNGAEADLTGALLLDQNRADLLVLRASAHHALGHKTEAATDLLRALSLYPNYPAALVERGTMKYEAGDMNGARADWNKAAASPSGGEAAETARRNLSAMGPVLKPGK